MVFEYHVHITESHESDIVALPSRRTLRDYTNWHKTKAGYQTEVFGQFQKYAKVDSLNEAQKYVPYMVTTIVNLWIRYVTLAFKVQEGLVFDGSTGSIIGFVDCGEINNTAFGKPN